MLGKVDSAPSPSQEKPTASEVRLTKVLINQRDVRGMLRTVKSVVN